MEIGMIGLGKMGLNLAQHFVEQQVTVRAFDVNKQAITTATNLGIIKMSTLEELRLLPTPRIVWVMVPAGEATNNTLHELAHILDSEDIVIDGGNSYYEDSLTQYKLFQEKGIHFFDVGTSGGINGARYGGNFMIGGNSEVFPVIQPLFEKIAQKNGYLYTGNPGSGHYLKMVHNGIEYGMMQSIAEGFDLLENSPYTYDNEAVAKVWNNGSVIRCWLMELAEDAFAHDPHLSQLKGTMYSSGEGRWTVEESLKRQVPLPVITLALQMRYRSLQEDTFTGKVVASLRNGFGGHEVKK